MPVAAPRYCTTPHCPNLVTGKGSKCAQHEAQRQAALRARRGGASSMGYGADHRRKREIVLKRDKYLCRYCRNVGRLTEGNIADHVLALVHGGEDTIANMACCCRRCHDEKTAKHDGGFGHKPNPIKRVEQFVPSWGQAGK